MDVNKQLEIGSNYFLKGFEKKVSSNQKQIPVYFYALTALLSSTYTIVYFSLPMHPPLTM